MASNLSIMSLNVNGLTNPIKRWRVAKTLLTEKNDIVCLQEIHLQVTETRYLKKLFRRDIWHEATATHSKGVMIVISKRIPWICTQAIIDNSGHYVILHGAFGQEKLKMVGAYAPNDQQVSFLSVSQCSRHVVSL